MTTTTLDAPTADPRLWREFAYVAGRWTGGDGSRARAVTDPADGSTIGHVAALSAAQAGRRHRRGRGRLPGLVGPPAAGARRHPAPLVRADRRRPRGSRADHDPRAGQADLRGARRDRLRRELRRVLRRGGPPPEHRGRHLAPARRRGRALARALGRRRADHALELPLRDDHPQGRRRARRRLHRARASRRSRRRSRRWRSPSSPSAPACPPASSTSSPATPRPSSAPGPKTRACASSPSPARPRSGGCSTASPPTP